MFKFILGLGCFWLGLEISKRNLKKLTGNKFKNYFYRLKNNLYLCLISGILFTAIIQSSSAVSIILIGLIEAKLIDLKSALLIMMGANIGTTVTVQIISFPILSFYPVLIISGITLIILGYNCNYLNKIGKIFMAFGLVFFGLNLMTSFFNDPHIKNFFYEMLATYGQNKYYGIIIGVLSTSILQSSSAVTGITVSLSYNNIISLPGAVAIAMGSNIGTCITGFLASFNAGITSKNLAKRHFTFNIIGVLIFIPFFNLFIELISLSSSVLTRQIANAHTFFNLFNVIFLLPFLNTFVCWQEKGDK